MAAVNSSEKTAIYHTLYLLNLSFARIVTHCQTLYDAGVLRRKFNRLYQAYAQELQAEINDETLDARDKELRDPDDVFIHAEERRKELTKQRKKR